MIKNTSRKIILLAFTSLLAQATLAYQTTNNDASWKAMSASSPHESFFARFNPKRAHFTLQVGGFDTTQGNTQNIGIDGLIGDHFTVSHSHDQNGLVGVGYYVDGINQERVNYLFGLNAFYLGHTQVKGNIIQEQMFTNLSYRYSLTNYPVYLAAKALIKNNSDKYNVTLDFGIGPNFVRTSEYREYSLDGGITIPDNAFSGRTRAVLSATVGIGVKFNNVYKHIPLELGYRFFYLGQGDFNKKTNQLLTTLNTGSNYAHALVLSVSI
ncbi:MAG: hypothetical protein P4M14_02910 [Gammaproteobacteria bacterium]|nr:hypothetical protein [Gammaproteobacteria bacterium]